MLKIPILECLFLIGGGYQLNDQYGPAAGFIILDGIRMLCEKMYTLILHFNYSLYIILLLEITKSIIIALKIMNLNILLLNFLKCIIGEYVRLNHARSVLDVKCPHWRLCWMYD